MIPNTVNSSWVLNSFLSFVGFLFPTIIIVLSFLPGGLKLHNEIKSGLSDYQILRVGRFHYIMRLLMSNAVSVSIVVFTVFAVHFLVNVSLFPIIKNDALILASSMRAYPSSLSNSLYYAIFYTHPLLTLLANVLFVWISCLLLAEIFMLLGEFINKFLLIALLMMIPFIMWANDLLHSASPIMTFPIISEELNIAVILSVMVVECMLLMGLTISFVMRR